MSCLDNDAGSKIRPSWIAPIAAWGTQATSEPGVRWAKRMKAVGVGAQGIKRRKRKRKLHDFTDDLVGDERRVFGRFQWGTYSPAGTFERGFFAMRQLRRNGSDHAARKSLRLLYLSLPEIAVVLGTIALVALLLKHIF
jgi:hypothetical protein